MIDPIKPFDNFTGLSPFSRTYRERLEALAHCVNELWKRQGEIAKVLARVEAMEQIGFGFWAVAGENFELGGSFPNQWGYAWKQGKLNPAATKLIADTASPRNSNAGSADQFHQPAYNLWEQNNTAMLTTLGLALSHPNATITLKPIPTDTPIYLSLLPKLPDMTPAWFFTALNEPDVECGAP